jgi:hypothetical protein
MDRGNLICTYAHSLIPLVDEYGSTDCPNFGGLHHHITILLCAANNIKNTGDLAGNATV